MTTPLVNRIAATAQAYVQDELRSHIGRYIDAHRDELIDALRTAEHERGRQWLHALCAEYPLAAGIVTMLMRGTPEQAIVNIERFDPKLARSLAQHIDNFKKLQQHWRNTHEST
jgi:hypothetical protein